MHRSTLLFCLGIAAAPLAVACDKSGSEAQSEATEAQQKANQQIAKANDEANSKIAQAQSTADQKIATAQSDFAKTREDYRHQAQSNLDSIDKDIATLDAKEKTATGNTRATLDAKLPTIHAQRDAFASDFRALQLSSAATWDSTRARLDKEWSDLKTSVDQAS